MKLTFQLTNAEFEDALAVCVDGETKELTVRDNHINFDVHDAETSVVRVQYVRNEMPKTANPIGKVFAYLLYCLISAINFFCDNGNGISAHRYFYQAKPFELKKSFTVKPTEKAVLIKYIPPKYDMQAKSFSEPDIEIGAEILDVATVVEYNYALMKKEFFLYHYPAYIFLFAIICVLEIFMATGLAKQLAPFDLAAVIGLSICCLGMLALLIVSICIFISTHRLFRQVDLKLSGGGEDK